jgi:predicted nucleic acid-binding Zn ribbon protein
MAEESKCVVCENKFIKNRAWQKFCSAKCRWNLWNNNNPRIKKGSIHG